MAHERTDIRTAVVAQLVAGNTSAGSRVLSSRLPPSEEDQLPLLAIYTLDEDTDEAYRDSAPRRLQRSVDLVINAWARVPADGDIDAALDALALEVETAMDADFFFGGKARNSVLVRTELAARTDGDGVIGCAQLTYAVTYRTDRRVAQLTQKFNKVDAQWQNLGKGPINPTDQAEDLVSGINQEP